MDSIAIAKPNISVLPMWEAGTGRACAAFAQGILERNSVAAGFFGPLALVYLNEKTEAPTGAPTYEINVSLTMRSDPTSPNAKTAAAPKETHFWERLAERMVSRNANTRLTAPARMQIIGPLPLKRELLALPAGGPGETYTHGRALGEPAAMRFEQVLMKNQALGLTASEHAPASMRAFAPVPEFQGAGKQAVTADDAKTAVVRLPYEPQGAILSPAAPE